LTGRRRKFKRSPSIISFAAGSVSARFVIALTIGFADRTAHTTIKAGAVVRGLPGCGLRGRRRPVRHWTSPAGLNGFQAGRITSSIELIIFLSMIIKKRQFWALPPLGAQAAVSKPALKGLPERVYPEKTRMERRVLINVFNSLVSIF